MPHIINASLSKILILINNHPSIPAEKSATPNRHIRKEYRISTGEPIKRREILYTITKGTRNPAKANFTAEKLVFIISASATVAATYDAIATGGVISEIVAK